jgi:secreted trypsin-like serine protease
MSALVFLAAVGHVAAIVGGYVVPAGQLRSAARILISAGNNRTECFGSVVGTNVILTAAHCVVNAATGRALAARDFVVLTTGRDASPRVTSAHGVGAATRFPRLRWRRAVVTSRCCS